MVILLCRNEFMAGLWHEVVGEFGANQIALDDSYERRESRRKIFKGARHIFTRTPAIPGEQIVLGY